MRTIRLALIAAGLVLGGTAAWGLASLESLNLPVDAATAARGGTGIAWEERLEGLALNPATLLLIERKQLSTSWVGYVADINQYNAMMTLSREVGFPLAIGLGGMHFGRFEGRDIWGNPTGDFTAQDIMLQATTAYQWNQLQAGLTTRLVYSAIEQASCTALTVDLGTRYSLGASGWAGGLVLQNAGFVLSEYSGTSDTRLPWRLRAGLAKRLKHLPLRWFLDYTLLGNNRDELQIGGEFYLPVGWTLRGGYLFEQGSDRLESLDEALRGVTFGLGGAITTHWRLDWGYTSLGVLGSVNHITLGYGF